ncbi:MAG: GntR family transcriptional regulator [Roseomonas sp.]|jgi:GntR family transcriptional regulator/MocR family aminotransferase|nr:GntR family transcriptional regulator [Roseomonas sp.]
MDGRCTCRSTQHLRADIISRVLRLGTRLPSTRALASVLGTSRNTVLHAFEELMTEGYLLSQRGSGTFVATDLPAAPHRPPQHPGLTLAAEAPCGPGYFRNISPALGISPIGIPFRPDLPALDQFPVKLWMRLAKRAIDRIARSRPDAAGLV